MPFNLTPNVQLRRDSEGRVRHIQHLQQPYRPDDAGLLTPTPVALVNAYLHDVSELLEIDEEILAGLNLEIGDTIEDMGTQIRLADQKTVGNTTVVAYEQTHFSLPIWEAGIAVQVHGPQLSITSSRSTIHYDVEVDLPDVREGLDVEGMNLTSARRILSTPAKEYPRMTVNSTRLLIYRYEPDKRFDPESQQRPDDNKADAFQSTPPILPLPSVPDEIEAGRHYVVREIMFTLPLPGWGELNWRAFIELRTGAVLYLRALVSAATGYVFATDPVSQGCTCTAASPVATLNMFRTSVTIDGLTAPANPGDPQGLSGEFVELAETDAPVVNAPTENLPYAFNYDATTDNFAAVNAYYHCDYVYRLIQGMDINLSQYFDGTTFPVPVDHRGEGGGVNAHAHGNAAGTGMGRFRFGLAQAGQPVGIATTQRVVLHEFGHTLLWDHVNSPNFGFAHSAGDSLAAILHDPGSQAGDRFLTFPFVTASTPGLDRRHDRDVAGGWAWGGTRDVGGYNSEQILSTTLFRAYLAMGGSSMHGNPSVKLARQQFAARYLAYLIIKSIGTLTPATNPSDPADLALALMEADRQEADFEGHVGGAFHKVIRWAFEKQGLFQPVGAPTPVTSEGAPPPVDVYIDDGRNGEYTYIDNFWNTTDLWNRLAADGGTTHETPVVGVTNYLYVRLKNRGSQPANNVIVSAYHCKPATGLVWPDDWQPMTTPQVIMPAGVPAGGTVIVGPFEWTPNVVGHECLLASVNATGDLSNNDLASGLPSAAGPIPHSQLVPFDNNIGQRNVAPVPGGGGGGSLVRAFDQRRFWAKNPYNRPARINLEAIVPDFLLRRGWQLKFLNPGGATFTLGARDEREVILQLVPGQDFSRADVVAAGRMPAIEVKASVDGVLVGGMTYAIDPGMQEPAKEHPALPPSAECRDTARRLLNCLDLPVDDVKCVKIRRITLDIYLDDDCDV